MAHRGDATRRICRIWGKTAGAVTASPATRSVLSHTKTWGGRGIRNYIDYLGNSNGLVFSADFSHGDSKCPESIDRFLQLDISDADKRQILWDNCAAYYGITG
jgi:predicted TIM-barrel fold metal-dependent hydrolase